MPAGNILVVDDDPTLVELLRMRLESANYTVTCAQKEGEAMSAVKGQVFDLSIIDLRLGEGDGITLMEEIHSIMPEMPIIIFIAHGTNETEAEAVI